MTDLLSYDEAVNELKEWKRKYPYASDDLPVSALRVLLFEPKEQKTPQPKRAELRIKRNDPGTSLTAALSAVTNDDLYRAIYNELGYYSKWPHYGLTDEQLVPRVQQHVQATASGIRSRRAELVEAGWVKDSGSKRELRTGRMGIVWQAVPDYR